MAFLRIPYNIGLQRIGENMRKVSSIAIIGGGSSGWMAAAHFATLFPDLSVSVVESDVVPVIGVGEATVPLLTLCMERLGFPDPQSWMKQCDATYKTGILFENWRAIGESYWHPFEYLDYVDVSLHTGHCWLDMQRSDSAGGGQYADAFFPSYRLNVTQNKAPAFREIAYHIDAGLLGALLQRHAPRVSHITGTVGSVEMAPTGDIAAVLLQDGRRVTADLFIDCTGFRRVLINAVAPENPFQSYARSLFCDRAVVVRTDYPDATRKSDTMRPFVRACAKSAGWIWTIPLYSRISSGYVYSSAFLSDDAAERELRQHLRLGDDDLVDVHKVQFETGKLRQNWVRNCIAVGLSGGFIEPLESTGLAITQTGIELAASMLDARIYDDACRARYNAFMTKFYEDVLYFIIVHYCLTARRDTEFWRAVAADTEIPDALAARLDVFRRLLPTSATRGTHEVFMFRDISWWSVLIGMGFNFDPVTLPPKLRAAGRMIQERKADQAREQARRLPNHYAFLRDTVFGHP